MTECTVIVSGNIKNPEKVDRYRAVAGGIMKKYGAIASPTIFKINEIIAGDTSPSFMMEIKFSDKKKAAAAFKDPDYMDVITARDEGFGDLSIFMIE